MKSNLCIVFRLISSTLPALPVSLLPPPPPLLMCVIPSMCFCITTIHYLELENLMQKTTNYKLTVGESELKLLLSVLKIFWQESDRRRYIVLLDCFLDKMVILHRLQTPRSWELWHLFRTQHLTSWLYNVGNLLGRRDLRLVHLNLCIIHMFLALVCH